MDEMWGTYESSCPDCGLGIIVVATVKSVEEGFAEAYIDGDPLCTRCEKLREDRLATARRGEIPPPTVDHL